MFFFFNDTATTEIYTLSLHDALPIPELQTSLVDCVQLLPLQDLFGDIAHDNRQERGDLRLVGEDRAGVNLVVDRKSTRLNSSHANISYAVFCLKKKN